MSKIKLLTFFIIFVSPFLILPLGSQTIDPETLKSILSESADGQQAKGASFETFTQNNYAQTLGLLKELDEEEERSLFYSSLMESRVELVSQLCAKDPRACYLIDEYRDMKFLEVPETIDNLKLFGLDVFAGYPINLDGFNELPLPSDYRLKVGDELKISIFGLKNHQSTSQISPMGELAIPNFGNFEIAGLSLSDAREELLVKIRVTYPGTEITLSLSQLQPKKVFVLGNVINPGSYGVNAFATAINALITGGGLQGNSSLRNIKINSSNKGDQSLDLYSFLINGETQSDVLLEDGDAVLVGGLEKSVHVFGEIIRPAIYEIKDGEHVEDILSFALGFTEMADKRNITLQRKTEIGSLETMQVSEENFSSFQVKSGDRIIVNAVAGEELNTIALAGAIRNPGIFQYSPGTTLSDLIDLDKGLLDSTYTLMGVIKRFDKRIRGWSFLKFDLLNSSLLAKSPVMPRDEIFVFSRDDIRFLNSPNLHDLLGLQASFNDSGASKADDSASLLNGGLVTQEAVETALSENALPRPQQAFPECINAVSIDESFTNMLNIQLSAFSRSHGDRPRMSQIACPAIFLDEPQLIPFLMINSIPVVGNIRLPALYPVSRDVNSMEIIQFAGGAMYGALESNIFDVVQNKKSLNIGYEDLNTITNIKFLNIRQSLVNTKQGYVTLHGEFKFPGTYSISDGETITSVFQRAGGLSKYSYPHGGILTRESVKEIEKKVLIKAQKDLGEVLASAAMNGYLDQNPTDLVQLIGLISSLSESDGLGRIVAELDPNKIARDSILDIFVEHGDNIYIPRINSTITIVGNVLNPITVPYNPKFSAKDYISLAGGFSKTADKRSSYIVFPNGISRKIKNNYFAISQGTNPVPGSTIIIPRKANNLDTMSFLKFATPILADLSVTAASISAITNN